MAERPAQWWPALAAIATSLAAAHGAAQAPDPSLKQLLGFHGCFNCHTQRYRYVGPPFAEVARRYANDPSAFARLAAKIRAGGAGAWGDYPMPAYPGLSEPEVRALLEWILAQDYKALR